METFEIETAEIIFLAILWLVINAFYLRIVHQIGKRNRLMQLQSDLLCMIAEKLGVEKAEIEKAKSGGDAVNTNDHMEIPEEILSPQKSKKVPGE